MLESEVLSFLNEFKGAVSISPRGIQYASRKENVETILDLELTQKQVDQVLLSLELSNYYQGPLPNDQYGNNPMWEFGRFIKGKEVYIKITSTKNGPFCISFHYSKYRMSYTFKKI